MEKKDLMEYLGAVCDAENAIYACDEAINILTIQQQGCGQIIRPIEPQRIKVDYVKSSGKRTIFDMAIVHIVRILFFVLCYVFLMELSFIIGFNQIIPLIGAVVLTFTVGTYLGEVLEDAADRPRVNKINRELFNNAEERNRQAEEEYTKRMKQYNKEVAIDNSISCDLAETITENKRIRQSLVDQLQQLYEMNIIYSTFRNIVAVNQIKEYLEMGVCNALEGPDGAYAQYLQDVRTNRICDSLTDLKHNLMSALSTLAMTQATLVHELRQTNSNIQEMSQSLNRELSAMRNGFQSTQSMITGQIDSYMQQTNRSLNRIEQTISASSYNQYIALRQSNVRKYLLKAPY